MRKRSGFTLIELFVLIVIILILFGMAIRFAGCGIAMFNKSDVGYTRTSGHSSYEDKLRRASRIEIIGRVISVGDSYDLYVDGERVGQVTGKLFTVFGNVFTLSTSDGKRLAYEQEIKRIFTWNRAAECYDGNGQLMGYFGEDRLKDLFSWGYIFHFLDSSKQELGKSQKIGKSMWNYHKLYDAQGNADYTIDKQFKLASGKYVLEVLDRESSIPIEMAILLVCIEDVIGQSNE